MIQINTQELEQVLSPFMYLEIMIEIVTTDIQKSMELLYNLIEELLKLLEEREND